jgi:hypothetical protein
MLEKHYRRICPDCLGKMAVVLGGNFGDYVWYCDDCKLLVWHDMIIMPDRVKKYLEE